MRCAPFVMGSDGRACPEKSFRKDRGSRRWVAGGCALKPSPQSGRSANHYQASSFDLQASTSFLPER